MPSPDEIGRRVRVQDNSRRAQPADQPYGRLQQDDGEEHLQALEEIDIQHRVVRDLRHLVGDDKFEGHGGQEHGNRYLAAFLETKREREKEKGAVGKGGHNRVRERASSKTG